MTRRRAWWTGVFLLAVVLLAGGGWRLSREVPEGIRRAEAILREEALRKGLRVSYRNLKLHILYLSVSLENLRIDDALSDRKVGEAERVDLSLSPFRLLSGQSPVSRVRARNFRVTVSDANRPLLERLRGGEDGAKERREPLPDIVLLGGTVRIGPWGPVQWWEAHVPELRIRDVRFLGTRVSASVEKAAGLLTAAGLGEFHWPFGTVDADAFIDGGVVRLRRLRAAGGGASLRASGVVDGRRETADLKVSGETDLALFPATFGGVAGRRAGEFVRSGSLLFTANVKGNVSDPSGSARLLFENVLLAGGSRGGAEIAFAAEKGRVRLESLRGTVLGGTVAGNGEYDLASGRASGKASLLRASLRGVPWWDGRGIGVQPAGPLDFAVEFSGTPKRLSLALSLASPGGIERAPAPISGPVRMSGPVSLSAAALLLEGRDVEVASARLHAGPADVTGSGRYSIPERRVSARGDIVVGPGRPADFGASFPLHWERLAGTWEADGTVGAPRVAARLDASGVSGYGLPPVNAVGRIEGEARGALHSVVDVTGALAAVTASATFTSPISDKPFAVEGTAAVRDFDFGAFPRWCQAFLASVGSDPAPVVKALAGASGKGTADARYSVSGGRRSLSGGLRFAEAAVRGVSFRSVVLEGEWEDAGSGGRWTAGLDGRVEGGTVRLSGEGTGEGIRKVAGTAEQMDVGRIPALFGKTAPFPLLGAARIEFTASAGAGGWEVPRFLATAPRLSVGGGTLEDVRAEGTLGEAKGRFTLSVSRPDLRIAGDVRREGSWPVAFGVSASNVPASFVAGLIGPRPIPLKGTWSGGAEGVVRLAGIADAGGFPADAVSDLKFSVDGEGIEVAGARFASCRIAGRREGDGLAGDILTRGPDTRLSFGIALRDPYSYRVAGGFSLGTTANGDNAAAGIPSADARRFQVAGRVEVRGALRSLEKSSGSLTVTRFAYREGDIEFSGKDLAAHLEPEGIRLAEGALQVAGSPVRLGGKISWKGDLDLRVEGRLPAGTIRLVVPEVFDRLDGTMALDLRIIGSWKDPSVVGAGRLEKGLFSFRGYAQLFEGMSAQAAISRDKIVFERFEGRSGGGYLDGWGEVPLRFEEQQRMFFSVDFFDMRFPYPEDFRPVVHGHAELTGPIDDLLVTGDVTVESALYAKRMGLDTLVPDFRKRIADVTARKEGEFRVRLDVNAIADGTIRIKNNLADAKGKGEFKVVGDSNRVIILGAFDVTEGTADYRGTPFDLKRVTVDFQDPRRNNPRLDIRAETKKGNVTVTVSVTGTLEKYEVDLASDPPLSKNDIVSLLSFGVTTGGLAGAEGSVGAGAAASIALGSYKGSVEEGVRGIVGLDRFAVEPSFSTATKTLEPKFIVGKSYGERFSVTMSTTVGTKAENSAAAELKLMENIYLQGGWESATTTKEGGLGADLKFKYRYRQLKDLLRGQD